MYQFDQKGLFDILDDEEAAKGFTAKTKQWTKVELTPLQTFPDTAMPGMLPRKSGMLQNKAKDINNVDGNEEDREEEEERGRKRKTSSVVA